MKVVKNYTHFIELFLKSVACWDWYTKPERAHQIIINNLYLALVMFSLANTSISLTVHLYTDWTDVMSSLDSMADGLPVIVAVFIVAYFASHKTELYDLVNYMNTMFKWRSAHGLTNMTMWQSYKTAKTFAYLYTACTLFSVATYALLPVIAYLLFEKPLQHWIYMDVTNNFHLFLILIRQCMSQVFVGLAVGQLGVFFACHSILLCGQIDLLCCSLQNVRFTALMLRGVQHGALVKQYRGIEQEERHNYLYNKSEMVDSHYHYDEKVNIQFKKTSQFDIYSSEYEDATCAALRECAQVARVIKSYKDRFESFVSPLLVLRVVQVTLYLCTLLYTTSEKFDMVTVEYLAAVALDMFVYCYFGNQITLQPTKRLVTSTGDSCHYDFDSRIASVARRITAGGIVVVNEAAVCCCTCCCHIIAACWCARGDSSP
nr:putative odorant receptor 85e isoform X2 [Danaus plexippus plexippus]